MFLDLAETDVQHLLTTKSKDIENYLGNCSKQNLLTITKQVKNNWRGHDINSFNSEELSILSQNEKNIGKGILFNPILPYSPNQIKNCDLYRKYQKRIGLIFYLLTTRC